MWLYPGCLGDVRCSLGYDQFLIRRQFDIMHKLDLTLFGSFYFCSFFLLVVWFEVLARSWLWPEAISSFLLAMSLFFRIPVCS